MARIPINPHQDAAVRLVQVSLGSLFETTSSQDRICASAGDCGTCAMGGLTEVLWLAGVGWAQGIIQVWPCSRCKCQAGRANEYLRRRAADDSNLIATTQISAPEEGLHPTTKVFLVPSCRG